MIKIKRFYIDNYGNNLFKADVFEEDLNNYLRQNNIKEQDVITLQFANPTIDGHVGFIPILVYSKTE